MTLDAMLRKETLVLLRSRRALVWLYTYLALLAGVILLSWPTGHVLTLAAAAAQHMVYVVGIGQLLLVLAIVPGLSAGSIVLERDTGALELLQMSRMSAAVILVGKWLGCVTFVVILWVSSLPLIALCQVLGTLDWRLLFEIYMHLLATTLWASMIGLGVSSVSRTSYGAMMGTYAVLLCAAVLTIIPSFLVGGFWSVTLRNLSPVGSMVTLVKPDAWRLLPGPYDSPSPFAIYLAFCAAGIVLGAAVTCWRLLQPYHPPQRRGGTLIDTRSEWLRRKLRFPFYLIDPQRRRRPIGNWINPVFAREVRSRMLGQASNFVRVFYAVLILSLGVTIYSVFRTEAEIVDSVRVLVIASQVILVALLAPALSSSAVSREREHETLDLLRLTHLGPWSLVAGKWYYSLMVSLCVLAAALPMWWVIFQMQRVPAVLLVRAMAVILAALVFGTVAGLFASSMVCRTGTATGLGYLITIGALFGTLLPIVFSHTLSTASRAGLLSLNPVVAAIRSVSLGLFRNELDSSAWLRAVLFLAGTAVALLVGAVLRTRHLYRSR